MGCQLMHEVELVPVQHYLVSIQCEGEKYVLENGPLTVPFATSSPGATRTSWMVNGQLIAEGVDVLQYTFDKPGNYEVELVSENDNCISKATKKVLVEASLASSAIGEAVSAFWNNEGIVVDVNAARTMTLVFRAYNVLGQLVYSSTPTDYVNQRLVIPASNFTGALMLEAIDLQNGEKTTMRLVRAAE
jgi:hypothetical protein